jgi:hypothetical protein
MARFVLAHPDPHRRRCRATSLHVDTDHPVARRMAAQAHGDLLVLERTVNEKTNKLRQDIQVDDVRRTVTFFGSTAGEGGWRVAIVDAVDELNREGANALLKFWKSRPGALCCCWSAIRRPRSADHPFPLPTAGASAALGRRGGPGGCNGDRRRRRGRQHQAAAAAADGSAARAGDARRRGA